MYVFIIVDVNGNKGIFNGFVVMFDNYIYYLNWMMNFDFNIMFFLFGVNFFWFDDIFDMGVIFCEFMGRIILV